jgi:hypothetical protein
LGDGLALGDCAAAMRTTNVSLYVSPPVLITRHRIDWLLFSIVPFSRYTLELAPSMFVHT